MKAPRQSLAGQGWGTLIEGMRSGFGGMLLESPEEQSQRRVGLFEDIENDIGVATVFAKDTGFFETAISDPRYKTSWTVVCEYKTREEAVAGHEAWVAEITGDEPPEELVSVQGDGEYPLLKDE